MVATHLLDAVRHLPREDKVLVLEELNADISGDFSTQEVREIKACIAEADEEITQGKTSTAEVFFEKPGL